MLSRTGMLWLAQVSGSVDGVFQMGSEGQHRAGKLAEATAAAHDKAVEAGASPSSCQVGLPCAPELCIHSEEFGLRPGPEACTTFP